MSTFSGPLGMIGGVKPNGTDYWQGLDDGGLRHKDDESYTDYSQLFREYGYEQKPGWVEVGQRNGKTVYAAPDYLRDSSGNYLRVSSAEAKRLAAQRGTLIPTRAEVKSFMGQAKHYPMAAQPIYKTGGPGDSAKYTKDMDALRGGYSGAITHGKEFYDPSEGKLDLGPASPKAPAPVLTQGGNPTAQGGGMNPLAAGILSTAQSLGMDPADLATIISYETAGTFDPTKRGPTTQWGQHRGLIQFGEPQARQYGVDWNDPLGSQLGPNGAVANYFRSNGWKPGMGLLDAYSIVNAGGPGLYNRSDANNGGAPGTVADKVNNQMGSHRQKAMALLGGSYTPASYSQPQGQSSNGPVQWNGQGFYPTFGTNLNNMITASGGKVWINSGYRSPEKQAQLIAQYWPKYNLDPGMKDQWLADVQSMGAIQAGQKWSQTFTNAKRHSDGSPMRNWIGLPGSSNHQKSLAADLGGDLSWAAANAAQYGLYFPLSNEPWHVELNGSRDGTYANIGANLQGGQMPPGVYSPMSDQQSAQPGILSALLGMDQRPKWADTISRSSASPAASMGYGMLAQKPEEQAITFAAKGPLIQATGDPYAVL